MKKYMSIPLIVIIFYLIYLLNNSLYISNKLETIILNEKKSSLELHKNKMKEYADLVNDNIYPEIRDKIIDDIIEKSIKYNIDDKLIFSIIAVESRFNVYATSSKSAIGLMQVRYIVWKDNSYLKKIGIKEKRDLFNPSKNIEAGTYILHTYINECKKQKNYNLKCVLDKYLGGDSSNYINKIKIVIGDLDLLQIDKNLMSVK